MNSITPALIDYLQKLPTCPAASRRQGLEEARRRVRAGECNADSLVPYALADHDEDVVIAATSAYVGVVREAREREAAAQAATEWIRRGLALNRGAVFSALLALGDEGINQRLIPLRLALTADDVATVCRRASHEPCSRSLAFLREWHELLGEGALDPERRHLSGVLVAA
jgi:hypothetical protein